MNNIILILTFLLLTSGCVSLVGETGKRGFASPGYLFLRNLPQGDDSYSVGFRQGCYNFIGQVGFGMSRLYETLPSNDPSLLNDQLYKQGYMHGDRHCVVYANKNIIL